ncbi:NAD-dependent epimerase/dehydratase family protein [Tengunoibacter tsumagoiensis]|uniref:Dihydroflavonol-4-reductase n=1 Tax=Tengunoibacter tsumagoiensis TaxID=2014871 RepID=A0A401ZW70_9CHLR|nr:NAD-dependent epimerase/dehydratase family protein [Tengunoibacter tsumagoiensis]GCE11149.1 dihydroflavonol-4-reductase [Tengunoibacter tsumagoiensis]
MKYFVTGATGFVGSHVVRLLIEEGHQVIAVVRKPEQAGALAALGVTLVPGDVTEKESMRAPMQGVDGVFHIAGWYKVGTRDKSLGELVNIQGTRNVLELMKELEIPRGVYTSTIALNSDTHGKLVDESYHFTGKPLSEYDRTKGIAHNEIAVAMIAQGLPLIIVQPGLIYGPGDTSSVRPTFIKYLQRKLPMVPDRSAQSWAHVEDVARGHIAAMQKGRIGESYLLTGPTHTIVEAMQIAEKITGIPAPRTHVAPGVMKGLSVAMGLLEKIAPVPQDYSSEYLRITAGTTYIGSYAKAERELGYQPRSLEAGLSETLAYEMKLLGMSV